MTVNYQKLKKVTEILQIAFPRVEEGLDILGGGSIFAVFDLFSGFTQLTIHPDTIPLTAFGTTTGLYEWLRLPRGAAGTPAWFVSAIRLVTTSLDNIRMYLDAVGWDDCPINHVATVATVATLFVRLRLHKLKLLPEKSQIGAARTTSALTMTESPNPHACLCLLASNNCAAYLAVLANTVIFSLT